MIISVFVNVYSFIPKLIHHMITQLASGTPVWPCSWQSTDTDQDLNGK